MVKSKFGKRYNLVQRMIWMFMLTIIFPVSLAGAFFNQYFASSLRKEIIFYSEQTMQEKNAYYQLIIDNLYQFASEAVRHPMIFEVLTALDDMEDPSRLSVDTAVFNASRIFSKFLHQLKLQKIELFASSGQGIVFSKTIQVAYQKPEFLHQLSSGFRPNQDHQLAWHWLDEEQDYPKDRLMAWAPIISDSKEFIQGYLLIYFDASFFHHHFREDDQYGQYFAVVNEEHLLLYYPDQFRVGTYLHSGYLDKIKELSPARLSNFDNQLSIVSYSSLKPMNWSFLSFIPYSYIRSRTIGILSSIALIIMILIVLSLYFSMFLSRVYLSPIERITLHFKNFQQGVVDLDTRLEEKGNNEITDLTRWFNLFLLHFKQKQLTDIKLAKSEKQYQELVNSIREILFRVDAQGIFSFINSTWKDITQHDVDKTLGRSFFDYVHDDDTIKLRYAFNRLLKGQEAIKEEIRLLRKDHSLRWMEIIAQAQSNPDMLEKTISGIMIDVTERKELDLMKDDFISAVCHEIKTPFTAIKEAVQIFRESYNYTLEDEDRKTVLDILHRNTHRFQRLIDDLFIIRQIDEGVESFVIRRHNFNQVMARVAMEIKPMAESRQLEFKHRLDDAVPLMEFDEEKITRAVRHLLDNAIRYTEKGSIELRTKKIGNKVRVTVKDTGIGISKEHYQKLFVQFSQISCGISRKTGGLGLGLVIAKKIIEYHGGKIWIESKENQGSSFIFELPLGDEA